MSTNNGTTDTMINTNGAGEASAAGNGVNGNGAVLASPEGAGQVRAADIVGEMQTAYLDYAMSVIVARALPDVRDGLKPVHRRILYAMYHDLSLTHDKSHKKSARIVGEVLGKYHPHGDVAVYDAMVRMAQDFSLRYPLIDGQGNFGSIDGDNAAAMRYTEARLAEISDRVLEDLDRDTVGWHANFDNTLREPDILPAALPNLLVNGASGIAVGMATNVPPHNLGEIVDALAYLIDNYHAVDEITVEQLMAFVKGPDFPTGGILYRYREDKVDEHTDAIAQGYAVGKSRLILQAKAHFEEMSRGRMRIVVTELPYQTNKTALIERIASLARDGKLEGLTDLRDESDRTGMRIVIELNRNADPKAVLSDLFKYTPLQQTFGMQLLALVDGQPRLLSLKRALHLFILHREEIVRRRSEFELAKAKARAHIVEGLLQALDILDEVIDTIRRSQNVDTARANLMKNFKFTEVQAQAILDMQLRRLAALERKKLKEEFDELKKRIKYLEELLADPAKILAVIKEELLALREKYADARRTQIVERTKGTLTTTDLLPQQDVWVAVNTNGDLMRQDVVDKPTATALRQLGKGGQVALLTANTRDWLYLFTKDGRCARLSVHEIPQDGNPKHLSDLCSFTRRDTVTAAITLPREPEKQVANYLFCATEQGMVKRVTIADFLAPVTPDFVVVNVDEKDALRWVLPTVGTAEILLVSATGQSIRFGEEDVRSMGLAAAGVGGIKLATKDTVVYAGLVEPAGSLVTLTSQGYGKQSLLSDYSRQGRNGSGIVTHKPTPRTGEVATALVLPTALDPETPLLISTQKGAVKSVSLAEIPTMGRGVQGKQIVELQSTERIVGIKRLLDKVTSSPDTGAASPPSSPPPTKTPPPKPPTPVGAPKPVTPAMVNAASSRKPTPTDPVAEPSAVSAPAVAPKKRNFVTAEATPVTTVARTTTAPPQEVGKEVGKEAVKELAQAPAHEMTLTPNAERATAPRTQADASAPPARRPRATAATPLTVNAAPAALPVTRADTAVQHGAPARTTRVQRAAAEERAVNKPATARPPKAELASPTKGPAKTPADEPTTATPRPKAAKPARVPPTPPSQLQLTAPPATALTKAGPEPRQAARQGAAKETHDNSLPDQAAVPAPAQAKGASEKPVPLQNLELFPVEAEAPSQRKTPPKGSKLEIAVSVNRPTKKK
ncbi:MAG: DNA gyrase subunit A [Caldilineaceae bacterium]|nr:DNA gyrase subunit A [Caldilineaceae bacterium]